jgi:hypothetical protein
MTSFCYPSCSPFRTRRLNRFGKTRRPRPKTGLLSPFFAPLGSTTSNLPVWNIFQTWQHGDNTHIPARNNLPNKQITASILTCVSACVTVSSTPLMRPSFTSTSVANPKCVAWSTTHAVRTAGRSLAAFDSIWLFRSTVVIMRKKYGCV